MQTLVVMALQAESQGLFEKAGWSPFYCGVGFIKATHHLTQKLLHSRPDRVINLGTAGSHQVALGEIVECTSFVHRQTTLPRVFIPETLRTSAITSLRPVTCGSADFIENGAPVTACDIFDMEAYALAYVCQKMKVPFTSLKYLTDRSDENVERDWKKNLQASAEGLLQQLISLQQKKVIE